MTRRLLNLLSVAIAGGVLVALWTLALPWVSWQWLHVWSVQS